MAALVLQKRHFEFIADVLAQAREHSIATAHPAALAQWEATVTEFIIALKVGNPFFDSNAFRKACGAERGDY